MMMGLDGSKRLKYENTKSRLLVLASDTTAKFSTRLPTMVALTVILNAVCLLALAAPFQFLTFIFLF